jgi:hypothetical protein
MSNKPTGGPAFPVYDDHGNYVNNGGLSIRDYFAAKAMQAAATNPAGADGFTFEERAQWAYLQADAMLKEREK